MKFRTFLRAAAASTSLGRGPPFRMVPVRAQLVIFSPFLRVAQDFVGLIKFLELFFRTFLILGDIGVMLACELAECLLDCIGARISGDAENVVVVLEFNCHGGPLRRNGPFHSQ